jgi:hypothetical protein
VLHQWFLEEKTILFSAIRSPLGLARLIVQLFPSEKAPPSGEPFSPELTPRADARVRPLAGQVIELLD